jgi:hypothetical protein
MHKQNYLYRYIYTYINLCMYINLCLYILSTGSSPSYAGADSVSNILEAVRMFI